MSDERDRWWYYAPRSMFVRGIFPIVMANQATDRISPKPRGTV